MKLAWPEIQKRSLSGCGNMASASLSGAGSEASAGCEGGDSWAPRFARPSPRANERRPMFRMTWKQNLAIGSRQDPRFSRDILRHSIRFRKIEELDYKQGEA